LISLIMVVRGVGVVFAAMPPMTAAFAALDHDQIGDASPQLNVIQRVGGSLGTAVIAVVLQSKLLHASTAAHGHASVGAVAHAFNQTYAWVIAISLLAAVPGALLWRTERRLRYDSHGTLPQEHLMEIVT